MPDPTPSRPASTSMPRFPSRPVTASPLLPALLVGLFTLTAAVSAGHSAPADSTSAPQDSATATVDSAAAPPSLLAPDPASAPGTTADADLEDLGFENVTVDPSGRA